MKKSVFFLLALCFSISCQAGNYFFEPVFNANERYETNLFMLPKPRQDNWISTISPALKFGLRQENGELSSNFTWNRLFYTNQSELTTDEELFSTNYLHNNERLKWGATGTYNNLSSINNPGTVNGLLSTQVKSKQMSFAPTVSYSLDELNSISLNYSYSNVTYNKTQNNTVLSDYTNHLASTSFNHVYSERHTFNMSLSGSYYKSQIQTTHNYVGQLGWQYRFSEQLSTSLSAGINYSQLESQSTFGQLRLAGFNRQGAPVYSDPTLISDTNPSGLTLQQRIGTVSTQRNNLGKVYSASITKSFERGSVSFSGSQNQTPSAVGLQTQQQLSISTAFTINERWTSGLSASYIKSQITGQSNSSLNRTNYSISPNINWKYSPEINLVLSYTYRQQEFQGSQSSEGNTFQLQFSYKPQINLR